MIPSRYVHSKLEENGGCVPNKEVSVLKAAIENNIRNDAQVCTFTDK